MKKIAVYTLLTIAAVTIAILIYHSSRRTITIGFIASLSGQRSLLEVSARNAIILAVDTINASGGVNGGKLELIIVDDGGTPEQVVKAVNFLIGKGAGIIIAPSSSRTGIIVAKTAAKHDVLVISPTTTTDVLSGVDDNFIRVIPDVRHHARFIADYAAREKLSNIAVVKDLSNYEFSDSLARYFKMSTSPKTKITEFAISGEDENFLALAKAISATNADAVVMITNDFGAAALCQQFNKLNYKGKRIGTFWAGTGNFISLGGKSAEDTILVSHSSRPETEKNPLAIEFHHNFRQRFKHSPDIFSIYSYDAMMLAVQAIKLARDSKPAKLKHAIISQSSFQGLEDDYTIDANGDAQRQFSMVKVDNGRHIPLSAYKPATALPAPMRDIP